MFSCSCKPENRLIDSVTKQIKPVESKKIMVDTLTSSFPLQIGNDKGFVKIVGIRTFEGQKLTKSDFIISLNEILNFSISKQLNKSILIDSNETVFFKDTVNTDYLNSAIIKNVKFNSVRANTLNFDAIFENSVDKKKIIGRFNLFYRTKKKGIVYGWITDEIKETLQHKINDIKTIVYSEWIDAKKKINT